jgi:hypothetical protein
MEADAAKLNFPDDSFDCVVDTFGLCSFDDPVGSFAGDGPSVLTRGEDSTIRTWSIEIMAIIVGLSR